MARTKALEAGIGIFDSFALHLSDPCCSDDPITLTLGIRPEPDPGQPVMQPPGEHELNSNTYLIFMQTLT